MGLQKSIPFYEVLSNPGTGVKDFWTKAFAFSNADKKQLVSEGFNKNVMVYSIINKISKIAALAPWSIYTVVNEQKYARYKSLPRSVVFRGAAV